MKNKITLFIFIITLGGCGIKYTYLPEMDKLSNSPYGSFIRLNTVYNATVEGELLAIQKDTIIIASLYKPEFHYIDTAMVRNYYLQFGKPKKYPWPPIVAISHGLWMVFTIPINAIITSSLSAADRKELKFYNMEFSKLSLYSRYPAGLPENFSPKDFKPAKVQD